MGWLQLRVQTDPAQAEQVEELLMELGAVSVTMEDAADQPLYEPALGSTPLWQQTSIVGLFDSDCDMAAVRQELADQYQRLTETPLGETEVEVVEDKDWTRAWMDDFQPLRFGRRLWICPSWHTPPDPEAANLMLDPGLAFGTGTHPTTALCLEWLDSAEVRDRTLTDYGCGSGILGLAALLLGAKSVVGVDTDPQALEASRENASRNGVAPQRLRLFLPEEAPAEQSDILLANILAEPLLELAPLLAQRVRPGGALVLSGILESQAEALITRYEDWFVMDPPAAREGWVRLTGFRRQDAG